MRLLELHIDVDVISPLTHSARRGATVPTRRGSVLLYAAAGVVALAAIGSLSVDYGRVQLAKTELQAAADSAARYAVAGLRNRISGESAAPGNAAAALADLRVDGAPIAYDPATTVTLGTWVAATKTFTPVSNSAMANAVKVTLRHSVGGNGMPLTLGAMFGRGSQDVTAEAIAAISVTGVLASTGNRDGTYTYWVPATSNPWLAGNTSGRSANTGNPHNNPDYAGEPVVDDGVGSTKTWMTGSSGSGSSTSSGSATTNYALWGDYATKASSPITAGGVTVTPGQALNFANLNGGANNSNSSVRYDADGNVGQIVGNFKGAENGKSDLVAPINSVVAVFLGADDPEAGGAPETLDFSTSASRNFQTLRPKLKQVFFIGDGRRANGEAQQFVVPAGATRLFIGTMDSYEWNNNVGGFEVTAVVPTKVSTVR